ncbi:MAG: 16S rRNA (cytidine(1402)-2'-O)-methyltransferase [Firmicutes bacterium]|nr:16S rRNA (cytidine(1402)-2'-O)-methyltransferase [Bacillota bacterium]MCL5040770.1 16S rRNA (cytidine(1402)-2'-O)-methyltransferase [Bacillota bacterium]
MRLPGDSEGGLLYICATPIGNLEDITLRVLRVLQEVDLIAAEDTRETRKILSHYSIKTRLTSYHEHNKARKSAEILNQVAAGAKIALVSDAGLPGISDPGTELVQAAIARGLAVTVLPGPVAFATALVLSGLPTEAFAFEGFLPRQKSQRREALERLAQEPRTVILYEAPHRLRETLHDLEQALGERQAAVLREMTKIHEEVRRGTLASLSEHFQREEPRGEITLVIGGRTRRRERAPVQPEDLVRMVRGKEAEGLPRKEAIRLVSRDMALPRRQVYQAMLREEGKT